MVELQLELGFAVRDRQGRTLPPERLHAEGARLMAALLDLEQCNRNMKDPATSSDAGASEVTVELSVTEESEPEAVECAVNLCRTAIHALGGSTPGWPSDSTAKTDFRPKNVQFDHV